MGQLENLPNSIFTSHRPGIYDTESATVIEMVGRLYKKVADQVDYINTVIGIMDTQNKANMNELKKVTEEFKVSLRQEFQDFIDIVELKYSANDEQLQNQLLNIIKGVDENKQSILNINNELSEDINTLTNRVNMQSEIIGGKLNAGVVGNTATSLYINPLCSNYHIKTDSGTINITGNIDDIPNGFIFFITVETTHLTSDILEQHGRNQEDTLVTLSDLSMPYKVLMCHKINGVIQWKQIWLSA